MAEKEEQKPAPKEPQQKGGAAIPKETVSDVLQRADIALDDYDDIFSDFDPSPYNKRLLSEDFLYELRRRCLSTGKGEFAVNFTLPRAARSEKTEALIKKRLKEHFRLRVREIEQKAKEKARNGAIRLTVGILLSLALFIVPELETVPVLTIYSVLIWYSTWSGLENILQASYSFRKRKVSAEKLLKADYAFLSEEDVMESMQQARDAEAAAKPPEAQK